MHTDMHVCLYKIRNKMNTKCKGKVGGKAKHNLRFICNMWLCKNFNKYKRHVKESGKNYQEQQRFMAEG